MKKLLVGLGLCATVGAACVIDVNDFSGKTCETASDCPDPYVCVAARAGAGRTCEVLGRPALSDGGDPNAGPVPTYCQDIQPILAATCVSSCHGADHTNGQPGFRLDYYAADGGEPGAFSKAERIKARASDFKTMPPPGYPAPSNEERALLARWAVGGAPLCDVGTPDGGSADGGSSDAGTSDAGR